MIELKDDFFEVESFLLNCNRIALWGTGQVFIQTNEHINGTLFNKVEYFIETNPSQDNFLSKPVKSIYEYLEEEDELEILLCSSYIDEIVEFLKGINTDKKVTLYSAMSVLLNNAAHSYFHAFDQFLDKDIAIKTSVVNNENKVGIYIHNWKSWIAPYYCLTLGVLLKIRGMDVRYIYDDIDDQQATNYVEYLQNTSYLLMKIKQKWDIPFDQLSSITKKTLNCDQVKKITGVVDFSKVSYTRKLFDQEPFGDKLVQISNNCFELAERLNNYFDTHQFDTVFAVTNLHYSLGVVEEICQSKNIHTTSGEIMRGGYSYSVTGPSIRQNDIPKVIPLLNEEEKNKLITIANSHMNKVTSEFGDSPFNFSYILIPLNIYWDSAAYSNDDVFDNDYAKWLEETIGFILNNIMYIHVIVRQHPHEKVHGTGRDLIDYLNEKFGDNQRFRMIESNDDISTYRLAMHSKLMLPNTSTVGLEAMCLNIPVITKSNVYYADPEICKTSQNREEYFSNIKRVVEAKQFNPSINIAINIEKAKLYLALTLINRIKTNFTHSNFNMTPWICNETLESLYYECSENGVFDAFEYKEPVLLKQVRSFS